MAFLLLFAFLAGLVTIFAPCIWPILPIILSSATTGGRKKPLGITLGVMLSFWFFTLTLSYIEKIIPFDPNTLRYFAVIVIGLLGLTLIVPKLSRILEGLVSRFSGRFGQGPSLSSNGFWSGFVTGASVGLVWSPCAGPILATIATLAATQKVNLAIVAISGAYILGVGIPLFIFAALGKLVFAKSRVLSRYTGRIQQIFGVIMIATAVVIATGYDTYLAAKLLDSFPSYSRFANSIEDNSTVKNQLDALRGGVTASQNDKGLFNADYVAPDFTGITHWLNPDQPLSINDLRGKVVLVDFWTYTCINCIRTLPYTTAWYDKYHDQGFVIIGVHTPEFQFEKDTGNVEGAIKKYGIHYPVAQDNDYKTWKAYDNQFWPAEYLIDAKGHVRRTHFGEGKYDETEQAIQELLKEAGQNVDTSLSSVPDQTPSGVLSPETYLGSARMRFLYPAQKISSAPQTFTLSDSLPKNHFSFGGTWTVGKENAVSGNGAVLEYNFYADKVFLVLRPSESGPTKLKVFVDDQAVSEMNAGADVQNGSVTIDSDRLYNLIDLKGAPANHLLRLEFETSGTQAFAFTFG